MLWVLTQNQCRCTNVQIHFSENKLPMPSLWTFTASGSCYSNCVYFTHPTIHLELAVGTLDTSSAKALLKYSSKEYRQEEPLFHSNSNSGNVWQHDPSLYTAHKMPSSSCLLHICKPKLRKFELTNACTGRKGKERGKRWPPRNWYCLVSPPPSFCMRYTKATRKVK